MPATSTRSPPSILWSSVILADDPHAVKPDVIKDIPIVRTVVGGITRYEA